MDLKKFKIVDSHHHLWDLSMKKHPWLCERPLINFRYGNYEQICKNFLVGDYMKVSENWLKKIVTIISVFYTSVTSLVGLAQSR